MFIEDYGVSIGDRPIGLGLPFSMSYAVCVNGKDICSVSIRKLPAKRFKGSVEFDWNVCRGMLSGKTGVAKKHLEKVQLRYTGPEQILSDFRLPIYYLILEALTAMEEYNDVSAKPSIYYLDPELGTLKVAILRDFNNIENKSEFEIVLN